MGKKLGQALLLTAVIAFMIVVGADAAINVRHARETMPLGWKYDPGYAVWRAERGLGATPQTWKKYDRERRRLARGDSRRLDSQFLSALDRTVEELADMFAF